MYLTQLGLILWWCHDRTSSTDLASLHWYSTLFEEHRPCFLIALLSVLISKDAPMASAHITVQEHGHLTRHDPFGCDQKQFYMFIVYLVHQVYCIHCVTTAEKSTSEVFVSLLPRAPAWWSALLLQLRKFTPVGGNCKVYLPDRGTRGIWAAKGGWVFYCKFYMYWCWNVNHAAKFKL